MINNRLGLLGDQSRQGPTDELAEDTIFEVLRNNRRRFALHYLKQEDESVQVRELVEYIAAWENEKDSAELSREERQRVHVSMIQSHLPAMAEAGLIDFDDQSKRVEITERANDIDIYLEVVPEGDIDWGEYYLGVTLFNAVIIGLVWVDLYPFGAIPDTFWLVFISAVFLVSAALHYWYQGKHQLGSGPPPVS